VSNIRLGEVVCIKDRLFKEKICKILNDNYQNNEFNVSKLSILMSVSERTLYRKTNSIYSMTPSQLLATCGSFQHSCRVHLPNFY